jgi:tetratricopeptide (TPR) repeat protein
VSRNDWYRNKAWSPDIEKIFFEKLSRARSQRDQYLVIQALELARQQPLAALDLVDHYFETRKSNFHDLQALLAKVDAKQALRDKAAVVETYKKILAREAEHPNQKSDAHVAFPYFVATEEIKDEYDFALDVLENRKDHLTFPLDRFKWHASYALISTQLGDKSTAKDHAIEAVAAAEAKKSGFRYHQNLGLVGKEHRSVVKTLIHLTAD